MENVARDERAGLESPGAQALREGGDARVEHEARVVAHAVAGRIETGKEARMRRQRERRHGHGVPEEHAFSRKTIQRRRGDLRKAVRAEPIGTRRVQGDDQDIEVREVRRTSRGVLLAALNEHEQRESRQAREPPGSQGPIEP
jgi:hypothetical protein